MSSDFKEAQPPISSEGNEDVMPDQPDGISAESDSITLSDNCELAATPVPEDGYIPVEGAVESVEEIDDVTINGQSNAEEVLTTVPSLLPWGGRKERVNFPTGITIDHELKSGEFIMRTLFAQFTVMVRKKIEGVMTEPLEKPLSKSLQLGEDPSFDQLLTAFGTVAEHCLPSLLRTLFAWYDKQLDGRVNISERMRTDSNKSKSSTVTDMPSSMEEEFIQERRDLAIEFVFCLVLIEVLKQLSVHPGHDDLIQYIENLAFKHFKYKEGLASSPNYSNHLKIADLYGEVIGVLAQSRFQSVRKRFSQELKELRLRENSQPIAQCIISLLMGMKFFRVKMVPIEEFEASFLFLQECGTYFLEVKDKDIKHSLAGLFVDILTPLAAVVKNEVNVPCLKNFVESLYPPTLELCTKNKHKMALFPLVTCLLCVSQKHFFIQNFHYFLAMVLSNLKNKDPQMARIGLGKRYNSLICFDFFIFFKRYITKEITGYMKIQRF
ncbi:protein furry homolog-like [Artemia franciscana]